MIATKSSCAKLMKAPGEQMSGTASSEAARFALLARLPRDGSFRRRSIPDPFRWGQAVELMGNDAVALAGDRLKSPAVVYEDRTTPLKDHSLRLQRLRAQRHGTAVRTQHLGQVLVGERQDRAPEPVVQYQELPGKAGFHGVMGVADHRLQDLRDKQPRVSQALAPPVGAGVEGSDEVVAVHSGRQATDAHHTVTGSRVTVSEASDTKPIMPSRPIGAAFGAGAAFQHHHDRQHAVVRKPDVTHVDARMHENRAARDADGPEMGLRSMRRVTGDIASSMRLTGSCWMPVGGGTGRVEAVWAAFSTARSLSARRWGRWDAPFRARSNPGDRPGALDRASDP